MGSLIKHLRARLKRESKNFLHNNKLEITPIQLKAAAIVRMALRDNDSELILMPIEERRLIELEKQGLDIQLHGNTVELINHKFSYHVELNFRLSNKLIRMFDAKLDSRLKESQRNRMNRVENGLSNVLQSMIPKVTKS